MFGITQKEKEAEKNKSEDQDKGKSARPAEIAAEKEIIANLPVGRTGMSRVEEELLCPSTTENEVQSWCIFKIMAELVAGFELLRNYNLAATIFGSSRSDAGDDVYREAEELARMLVGEGFAVITGGANGVMNAANKGAKDAGGKSVGLNIKLRTAQQPNAYTTVGQEFDYFFTRKLMLSFASEVYIFFPGGFGTLDELFEIMTLIQTKKIKPLPVILVGTEYWQPLILWFTHTLTERYHTIDADDMKIYHLVNSVDEAMEVIKRRVQF